MQIILAYFFDIFFSDFYVLRYPLVGIEILTNKTLNFLKKIKIDLLIGFFALIFIESIVFISAYGFILLLRSISNTMEFIGEVYLIFIAFSIRLPEKSSNEIYDKLYENDMPSVKDKLFSITEKSAKEIEESDLIKLTIMATAQNCLHDFFTPIFYAFCGGGILAILCKASYIVYHTIMKDTQYSEKTHTFPSLIMDMFNFLPSRLLYIFLPLLTGYKKMKKVIISMWKNSSKYSYFNDGIPIAAFAANLNANLLEENSFDVEYKHTDIEDILESVNYMYKLSYLVLFLVLAIQLIK